MVLLRLLVLMENVIKTIAVKQLLATTLTVPLDIMIRMESLESNVQPMNVHLMNAVQLIHVHIFIVPLITKPRPVMFDALSNNVKLMNVVRWLLAMVSTAQLISRQNPTWRVFHVELINAKQMNAAYPSVLLISVVIKIITENQAQIQ